MTTDTAEPFLETKKHVDYVADARLLLSLLRGSLAAVEPGFKALLLDEDWLVEHGTAALMLAPGLLDIDSFILSLEGLPNVSDSEQRDELGRRDVGP